MAALMVVMIWSAAHTMPTVPLPYSLMISSRTRIQRILLSLDTIVLLWRRSACTRRPNMIQTLILMPLSGSCSNQRNGGKPVIFSLNLSHILALFVGLHHELEKELLLVTEQVTKLHPYVQWWWPSNGVPLPLQPKNHAQSHGVLKKLQSR